MRRLIYSPLLPFEIAQVRKQFSPAAPGLWTGRHPLARYPPRRLDVPHNVVPPRPLDIALLQVVRYVVNWRAGLARLGAAAMTSPGTPDVIGHAGRFPNVLIHAVEHPVANGVAIRSLRP
jgi:hypothetical protein